MGSNLPSKAAVEESYPQRGLRILVVEDNADLRVMLRMFLESLGYWGCVAKDMASGLQAAQEASFDVLLCDILLPDGDGCELLRRLTARGRQPRVAVAMSCYSQHHDVFRSKAAGFAKHLIKPFLPGVLEHVLNEYARQEKEEPAIHQATPNGMFMPISPSTRNPRIIVVDDHDRSLQVTVGLVRKTLPAAEIVAAETDREALHAIEQGGADFLVTNHRVFGLDGATLIRRARPQRPGLPIVMISAQPEARPDALAAGANWFLTEDQTAEQLPVLLRNSVPKLTT